MDEMASQGDPSEWEQAKRDTGEGRGRKNRREVSNMYIMIFHITDNINLQSSSFIKHHSTEYVYIGRLFDRGSGSS